MRKSGERDRGYPREGWAFKISLPMTMRLDLAGAFADGAVLANQRVSSQRRIGILRDEDVNFINNF